MKKFWIIFGSIIGGLLLIAYLGFLFVLPNAVDLNKYKPLAQKLVKEQIPLNIDFKNAKIITTPLLSIGLKADDISVKFEDNTNLFSADNINFKIALPSIFALTVKVPKAEINNPNLNFDIVDGKQFKILTLVEQILLKQEETITQDINTQEPAFDPSIVRIKVPNVIINNYNVLITDQKTGHDLNLKGEQLKLGYFNGKIIKIKTDAQLFSDKNKKITANVDINTFLPPATKLDEEDDEPERIELPFINPVLEYQKYDLKTNVSTKLKIRERNGLIKLYGALNIDDTSLKLGEFSLPKCYFHGIFKGTKTNIDTVLPIAKNETIKLNGLFDYGKRTKMDFDVNTDKIYFQDVISLAKAYLDTLHIKNELNTIKGLGYIEANARIKTDLKSLESGGKIIIKDGGIINKNINLGITKTNLNLNFDDNNLNITDSSMFINNSILKISGNIDKKSNTDIKIFADRLPLVSLYKAFAPNDLKKTIFLNNGDLTINANITGQLKHAIFNTTANLRNFLIQDSKNSFKVINDDLNLTLNANAKEKTNKLNLENKGLSIILPQVNSTIKDNLLKLNIDGSKLTLEPTDLLLNNTSAITFDGIIDSNKSKPIFEINGKGNIIANDLKRFAGDQAAPFIAASGKIPFELNIDGNNKRQNLVLRIAGSASNYITPITFSQLKGKDTLLQTKINFKGDRLKIKETGFYTKTVTTDEKGNKIENLNEILGLEGTIVNLNSAPFINVIKVTIPQELSGKIHGFKDAGFNLNGRLFVFGNANAPRLRGKFNIKEFYIKDLKTNLENLALDFRGRTLNINAKNLLLNGSDINSQIDLSLEPSTITQLENLKVNSKNLDLDKLMMVATAASRIVPANTKQTAPEPVTNIPVSLKNSSIDLKHIKTGNIHVYNTLADISLNKNIFYINNLKTRAFKGNINGDIALNLLNNILKLELNGKNLDANKLLVDAANMKDTLDGKLAFNTDMSIDIGTTDLTKQMQSLLGTVNFTVKDGQFGPFGKLENMIIAENIRESQFFQTALGGVINGLTSIDTTHFKELKGALSFKDGITTIKEITSDGNVLTLYIAGDFDLIKNSADMKVRGRLASMISNILGPIANVNPINLVKVTPGLNVASAKMFSLFTQVVTEEEMNAIPAFETKTDNLNSTNFQIVVQGDVAKPLTLVKSFKWLALQTQVDNATQFVATLPEPETLDATMEEIEAIQAEQAKTTTKIKNIFFKKDKKLQEQRKLETQKALQQMKEQANQTEIEDL